MTLEYRVIIWVCLQYSKMKWKTFNYYTESTQILYYISSNLKTKIQNHITKCIFQALPYILFVLMVCVWFSAEGEMQPLHLKCG